MYRHVNAEFGSKGAAASFAYVFGQGIQSTFNYGQQYMLQAVRNLVGLADYETLTAAKTGIPTFRGVDNDDTKAYQQAMKDAVTTIAAAWQSLLDYGCGTAGHGINNPNAPNQPPS